MTVLTFRHIHCLLLAMVLILCNAWAMAKEPMSVVVALPERIIPTQEMRLSGTLIATKRALLSPHVAGLVSDMKVDVGHVVNRGDVLLQLDDTLERHSLAHLDAQAKAALATMNEDQRLVDEADRLVQDNHLPVNEQVARQAKLATSKALYDAAAAEVAEQKTRVEWHRLTAPFNGVISQKLTESGEWITQGKPVFELVATDQAYLDVQAPQESFAQLELGTVVDIRPDALPGATLSGQIAALVPVSDSGTRTFRVRIVLDDPQHQLLPGTSAMAVFDLAQKSDSALMVPRDALLRSPDGRYSVFAVVEDGDQLLAQHRVVKLGHQGSSGVEILSGIEPEERIVVRGNEILRNNQPVKILSN